MIDLTESLGVVGRVLQLFCLRIPMGVYHTQQCPSARNCRSLIQIIVELIARIVKPLSVPQTRTVSSLLCDADWLQGMSLPLASSCNS